MVGYIIGAIIVLYTAFIVYKKTKDMKAGKSCCGGCSNCQSKGKCKPM